MANGEDASRTQPEFSLGERLARLEAIIEARNDKDNAFKELFEEKLDGLRTELGAINTAQKEAVSKAETATDRRLELIGAQIEADRTQTNTRLQALESGQLKGRGAAEFKSSTVAWITALAGVGLVVAALISAHAFG